MRQVINAFLLSISASLFITSTPLSAGEIVLEELGLGKPKKERSDYTSCGTNDSWRWSGGPVFYFVLRHENSSETCELKWYFDIEHIIKSYLSEKVKKTDFGPKVDFETDYFDFKHRSFSLQYKEFPKRRCYGFIGEKIQEGKNYITGIFCGNAQTIEEFQNQLSTIRLDTQRKRVRQITKEYEPKPATTATKEEKPTPNSSETNKTSASTLEERLSNLKKLEQKGLITKEEAQQKRKKLLNEL